MHTCIYKLSTCTYVGTHVLDAHVVSSISLKHFECNNNIKMKVKKRFTEM